MELAVYATEQEVAQRAAELIEAAARAAVQARGKFTLAVSGGRTPWLMLRALAARPLPWNAVHLFQVDERVAPDGDPERNFTHITESLLAYAAIPAQNVHAMLTRLRAADRTIPAGRVRADIAILLADRAAAGRSTA